MTFALSSVFAQYGGGGSDSGGGGYSGAYWVIVALIALVVVAAIVWLISRLVTHRRTRQVEPLSPTSHDRLTSRT
jgi:uncharacterized membrane protein